VHLPANQTRDHITPQFPTRRLRVLYKSNEDHISADDFSKYLASSAADNRKAPQHN